MAKSLLNSCRSGLKVESPYACTYSEISETAMNGHKAYTYSCSFRAFSNGEMTDMIRETVVAKINNVFYVFQSVSRNAEGAKVADFFYAVDDAFQFAAAA